MDLTCLVGEGGEEETLLGSRWARRRGGGEMEDLLEGETGLTLGGGRRLGHFIVLVYVAARRQDTIQCCECRPLQLTTTVPYSGDNNVNDLID